MRAGKITFDGYNNYGNSLQNYALQEYLKNYFTTVDTIWHSPEEQLSAYWDWSKKDDVKFLINYRGFRDGVQKGIKAWELARRARGLDFTQEYINYRYDVKELSDITDDYEYFIVGSDQVWNPDNPRIRKAFLDFAPEQKRISFAASIGAYEIPEDKKKLYVEGLKGMKAISVREERAAEVVFELTGREATVILDPVFCISDTGWRKIGRKPFWLNTENYLFAYFLGDIPTSVFNMAKSMQLEIVSCFDKNDFNKYIISPQEWIYLISNASFVATDSFHATAFSMIFKRSFFTYNRGESKRHKQMITRITSLLRTFGMEEHFVDGERTIEDGWSDAEKIEKTIEIELKRTRVFMERALS